MKSFAEGQWNVSEENQWKLFFLMISEKTNKKYLKISKSFEKKTNKML